MSPRGRLSGPQTSSDSSRAMTPASITMTPTTRRLRPWVNAAGMAKRKIAPSATKAMPTPVLITDRQPTGWTRPGLFAETDSSVSD